MPSFKLASISSGLALVFAFGLQAQDLQIKKSISVGGYAVSSTDTSIKGARTRDVTQTPAGSNVTIRQCDARHIIHVNEQAQTYFQEDQPLTAAEAKAAALATGAPMPDQNGGKIDVTTTVTDTGERKTLFGYQARHLKSKIVQESSANACTQLHQSLEIDGWYADLGKDANACSLIGPPVPEAQNCKDSIVMHRSGSGKPGYPLSETIATPGPDGTPTTVTIAVTEIAKQPLEASLFEIPKGFRQVNSLAELAGAPAGAQMAAAMTPAGQNPMQTQMQAQQLMQQQMAAAQGAAAGAAPQMGGVAAMAKNAAMQQMAGGGKMAGMGNLMAMQGMAGMQGAAAMQGAAMQGMGGMQGGPQAAASQQVAVPQVLGPKAAGKIRVGIAPPDAQLGQGNNANADYSTPIRNAIVALMSGPAVEIAALDSHVPIQLQAEAQQKQCDFILYSAVAVKHGATGGLGGFMKKAAPIANMTPMGAMSHMGTMVAAQAASTAASMAAMSAQQQAMNQLAGFNGQIKSKDDVTVQYQLFPTGQTAPRVQNELKGKAKSDGEDVLTPLLQQTANTVLTEVTKK